MNDPPLLGRGIRECLPGDAVSLFDASTRTFIRTWYEEMEIEYTLTATQGTPYFVGMEDIREWFSETDIARGVTLLGVCVRLDQPQHVPVQVREGRRTIDLSLGLRTPWQYIRLSNEIDISRCDSEPFISVVFLEVNPGDTFRVALRIRT